MRRSELTTSAIRSATCKFDRRYIYEWASENVSLSGAYRHTGKFSISHSPQLKEPLEQFHIAKVRVISCRFPVRAGKSLMGDLVCLWAPVNAPGPLLWNLQTDPLARIHCKTRIWPIIQKCDAVVALLPSDRHAKNIREIHFKNGMPLYVQGPSLRSLQGRGVRYLINDELHTYEPGRLAEAMARTGDFDEIEASKTLNIGQGSEDGDDADRDWHEGDCREWEVRCMACGEFFRPTCDFNRTRADGELIGMIYTDDATVKNPDGALRIADAAKTVRYRCPHCLHEMQDTKQTRAAWNASGRYVATNPNALTGHVSFHFEAAITRGWRSLCEEYLKAQVALRTGDTMPMQIYVQKRRALAWSELMLFASNPPKTFVVDSEWTEEFIRIMTVDKQSQGVYWVMVRQWAKSGESRRLWYGKLHGEMELVTKQDEFKVWSVDVMIDAGNYAKGSDGVFAMCVRNGWHALIGDNREQFIHKDRDQHGRAIGVPRPFSATFASDPFDGSTRAQQVYAKTTRWSNHSIRNRLQQLIDRGFWKEPPLDPTDEHEVEYARQMGAVQQKLERNKRTGRMDAVWYERSKNNHAHDCACMQVVKALQSRCVGESE